MSEKKKRKIGVGGYFGLLFTPFILFLGAVILIFVFLFNTLVADTPVWNLLTRGNGIELVESKKVEIEWITPEIIEDEVEQKKYYNADDFPAIDWAQQWATISIDYLGTKDVPVYNGDTTDVLDLGLGRFFFSNYPGQGGNCVIDFHVNRNKANGLYNLEDLPIGEYIVVNAMYGKYTYVVTSKDIFEAEDTQYVIRDEGEMLTLYTCYPKQGPYRSKRIAITAVFVEELSDPVWR